MLERPTRMIGGIGNTTLPSISSIVQQQFMDIAPRKTQNRVMGSGTQSALGKVPQSHRNSKGALNLIQGSEKDPSQAKQQVSLFCDYV